MPTPSHPDTLALDDLLVVEASASIAAAYCGRLFATYGANVVIAEPPGGSALRRDAPRESAAFLVLGAGKSSLVVDSDASRSHLDALLARAHVIIADDILLALLDTSAQALTARYPSAVIVRATPFGDSGPYAAYASLPGVQYALGGYTHITGDPGLEPLGGPQGFPGYMNGLNAFIGALAALRTRRGQVVETSELESLAAAHQWTMTRFSYSGGIMGRNNSRYDSLHPVCYYECADGTVSISPSTEDQLVRMMAAISRDELLADERFDTNYHRILNADAFDAEVQPWFAARTRREVTEILQTFRVPTAPALEVDETLQHEQLLAREFWRDEQHPVAGKLRLPGPPFRLSESKTVGGRSPLLGEGSDVIAQATSRPLASKQSFDTSDSPRPPLAGLRILDLTRVWSGPLATRILGDLGAEVIKIEHPTARGPAKLRAVDPIRAKNYPDSDPGDEPWNAGAPFNKLNRNKMSLTLDLSKPEGRQVFCDLVATADIVIENYSPRVMGNLGLDFETLASINPRVSLVSMPGYGLDGPMRDGVAYGTTLDAEAGIASLLGYERAGPQRLGVALPDPVGGMHAAAATLTVLHQRERTGRGQHVDLSQLESMLSFLADEVVEWQLSGQRRPRIGNRHPQFVPHGVYGCAGEDRWVFIGVESDEKWQSLARAIGRVDLAEDGTLRTVEGRRGCESLINAAISEWTATREHRDAMAELQAAGIPAGAVLDASEVTSDPHLAARDFFVELDHAKAGRRRYPGQPIRFSDAPHAAHTTPPLLGEHNEYVLGTLLGRSQEQIAQLRELGVIAERPPG